jgi:hypothetical protein
VNPMLRSTRIPTGRAGGRGGKSRFVKRLIVGSATTLLMSGGLGWAGLELAAGTAQAGAFHWCPGDPPPSYGNLHANPDWDTTVCHDYAFRGNQVMEGNPCTLPSFQWFMCPPGTTPMPLMPLIPNK